MSVEQMLIVFEVGCFARGLSHRPREAPQQRVSKSFGGAGGSIVGDVISRRALAPRTSMSNIPVPGARSTCMTLGLAKELGPGASGQRHPSWAYRHRPFKVGEGAPFCARILGATAKLERPGTTEEIAEEAAVWLISDAAIILSLARCSTLRASGDKQTLAPGVSWPVRMLLRITSTLLAVRQADLGAPDARAAWLSLD